MRYVHKVLTAFVLGSCCFLLAAFNLQAQNTLPAAASADYPNSAAGLQLQLADMLEKLNSNDQVSFRAGLDSLSIPNPKTWFSAHFAPQFLQQVSEDYDKALTGYQSHIYWVMGNFGKLDNFALIVEPSDLLEALLDSGFESLLPRPIGDSLKIENYRIKSAISVPQKGMLSWVSSFIYIDGRFRYVGGTYPSWQEKLTALRGPMSMRPAVIRGTTVQGVAFQKDQPDSRIAAIVQLKIEIDRDGHVTHIKVASGKEPFTQDAKDYVKATDFGKLPNIPQFPNAKRVWDLEVAFFNAPK